MNKQIELNIGPISKKEQARLNQSRIFIAGCGGIGGYLVEYMTRVGIGHIVCADNDRFEESNLNRQLLADSTTIGCSKAHCAAERVHKICPQTDIRGLDVYLNSDNLPGLIDGADIVMDALDNLPSRKILQEACFNAGIALAHGAAAGWRAQAAIVKPGMKLYDMLYSCEQKPAEGILSFTAAAAASMQAALAVKYLCGRHIENYLYILDLQTIEMDAIKF